MPLTLRSSVHPELWRAVDLARSAEMARSAFYGPPRRGVVLFVPGHAPDPPVLCPSGTLDGG